jgi:hypothetical protein
MAAAGSERLSVAVFSFNRGPYLAQCLASIARHMPDVPVSVHDDNSTDPETCALLGRLDVPVIQPTRTGTTLLGGLYNNMQAALDAARTEWIFFLQDDMQIVRDVGPEDYRCIAALFEADPTRAFVQPLFMKEALAAKFERELVPLGSLRAYGRAPEIDRGRARYPYSDVSIAHVGRLRAAGWQFRQQERLCEDEARRLFSDMPFLGDPFAFYCPEVPCYRNRTRTLSGRIAGAVLDARTKGYHPMTADQISALCARPIGRFPYAEDHLTPTDPNVRRPFVYQDFQARGWLRPLAEVERLWMSGRRRIRRWRDRLRRAPG